MDCSNTIALIAAIVCLVGCGRSGLLDNGSAPLSNIGSDSAMTEPAARSTSDSDARAGEGLEWRHGDRSGIQSWLRSVVRRRGAVLGGQ
jgi:hypothetical protein